MDSLQFAVVRQEIAFGLPYTYARGHDLTCTVVRVELRDGLRDGAHLGRGEGAPFESFFEVSAEETVAELEAVGPLVESGTADRADLLARLRRGAARNALDAALWDLAAKRAGVPVWRLLGTPEPKPLEIMTTISLAGPGQLEQEIAESRSVRVLKLKLGSPDADDDVHRLERLRAARPDARIVVDVNGGWDLDTLRVMLPLLEKHRVRMLEQPVDAASEPGLRGLPRSLPIVADESFETEDDLERVRGLYDGVNVKLDKCGGLTAALRIIGRARREGLRIMVGCLPGSSLSAAVGFHAAQLAEFVDLDGHVRLVDDIEPRMTAKDGWLQAPARELWG
ncbi:dipeptide epimerase [Streptomyces sp. BPTC-684]|uniref:dipeptide epimerase n=1 Tax=Streptomyces sp. BPTC-684 TaxID=3043734 RepID=UPI0024B0A7AB|nr:dipeptide epimerase [Streptomyces sp. BPTC-684]WHM37600.1 dipeptide epimerase [Streptomyces sp. BPTC-684]